MLNIEQSAVLKKTFKITGMVQEVRMHPSGVYILVSIHKKIQVFDCYSLGLLIEIEKPKHS
jgi:hypothetical protein